MRWWVLVALGAAWMVGIACAQATSLAWDYAPGSTATQFDVYQQTHCAGPYTLAGTVSMPTPAPTVAFTTTWAIPATLAPDCSRWYVTAANGTGESAPSNVVMFQTTAAAPANLRTQ